MYNIGKNLVEAAEQLEAEKNIPKQTFIRAICDAIGGAYKKKMGLTSQDNILVQYDEEAGEIGIFAPKTVVAELTDAAREISLKEAQEYIPDVLEGEVLELDVTPEDFAEFGRIAATTAKQIMTQRIREAEKSNLRDEFKQRQGTTMAGIIKRIEYTIAGQPNVVVDLGSFDAQIPLRYQLSKDTYKVGSRIRVFILEYREDRKVPVIVASHTHENLVKELFEIEVPEIEDKTVEIRAVAREAGQRTKIAVASVNDDVDPVGACIGSRGSRIQNILSELKSEKIDIVRYSEDPVNFISSALSPAQVLTVALFDDGKEKRAEVTVASDQLSLAIGRGGQNVRMAARLTGWKIDIKDQAVVAEFQNDNQDEEEVERV
ncbi:MAG: transcription termination factor NusA [Candidatus Melainabacteria bacterium]|nr:transcription termination factor NusA [Candidatus Melainabacteria bacterium]